LKAFSHIYIEEEILNHPITKKILDQFPNSEKIEIQNYKNIFNRSNQDFVQQKASMKLILAKKKDQFLYKGSENSNDFGNENFYYNTLILNCIYNCDYCFLQGMFPSGNIVIFVNQEDFFAETEKVLQEKSMYLCISYETDLLAFEKITGFTEDWISFAKDKPNLKIEIRTKSLAFSRIAHLQPNPNIILAYTISPEEIIKAYEKKTPTLNRRLESIQKAIEAGWSVRVCIDPILAVSNWKELYQGLLETIFEKISFDKIADLSLGTFRINKDFLKRMKKIRTDSDILFYPFEIQDNIAAYPKNKKEEMIHFLKEKILTRLDENKIFIS
jgi:spore photoproduct lyase